MKRDPRSLIAIPLTLATLNQRLRQPSCLFHDSTKSCLTMTDGQSRRHPEAARLESPPSQLGREAAFAESHYIQTQDIFPLAVPEAMIQSR